MERKLTYLLITILAADLIGAARDMCPSHPNCVCGGTFAVELNCNIDGQVVTINLLPNTYMNIKCENATTLDYSQLPKYANQMNTFKSVTFKDCPLPTSSFKDVLLQLGVSKTMSLIFQNAKKLSGYFNRGHFAGLENLTKLLLSVNGLTRLPDNLFMDINNLTWLNIRCNNINLSEELFKPLEKLETLEISHNQMTNMSSNLFSHLAFLRKLSLWQSNVTWFSKDFFSGVDVLEELDLSSNGLNELPTSIFKPLTKLKKLTLFSNRFSWLPQNLFSTNNKLETVIILNNDVKMKELPRSLFGNLPSLKQIYIQRSGIEVVPYDLFVNSPLITNISLAYNDIAELPELIFNDQINLLELDLSHNGIRKLESKIFSSLVRLETLNLCWNSIGEINGTTFSSLLSLLYLNMEHNNLKKISSYMFNNNRQRMSINLAYNQLDFQTKALENNGWNVKYTSPFAHTYNLRVLNLSHNDFKVSYDDWWVNGHEILDISFNKIQYFWATLENGDYKSHKVRLQAYINKPLQELWILNNPIICCCDNIRFLDLIRIRIRTTVIENILEHCPMLIRETCYIKFVMMASVAIGILFTTVLGSAVYVMYRKQVYYMMKKWFYYISNKVCKTNKRKKIMVQYSAVDEEFLFKKIMPAFNEFPNLSTDIKQVTKPYRLESYWNRVTSSAVDADIIIVIFSPNYLTSGYSHINIKEIRSEMMKSKSTVYVFTDIGPDNSIYTFLKNQRDIYTTVLWNERNFRDLLEIIASDEYQTDGCELLGESRPIMKPQPPFDNVESASPFIRLSDWADISTGTFAHSQV